ncbi:hypothetical protein EV715DRAFT_297451 [Schizophyllum commune]
MAEVRCARGVKSLPTREREVRLKAKSFNVKGFPSFGVKDSTSDFASEARNFASKIKQYPFPYPMPKTTFSSGF